MLSIGIMNARQSDYYLNLAREDYYVGGGEPEGVWLGRGARELGLTGRVTKEDLSSMFRGFSPNGEKLVQNANKNNRQPAWDLTFSCPKSVSILWSQVGSNHRQEIQAAHATAVVASLKYIESNFAYSRIGKGGGDKIRVGLVIAAFEHCTSRALDPQYHTHALCLNLGVGPDGKTRSIISKNLFQVKMLCGAYYRAELAQQLQERLGVELERPSTRHGKTSWFEVQGIPKKLLTHFSKRREAILKELGSRGLESASAAAVAALGTRDPKKIAPPRKELLDGWKQEALALGFSSEQLIIHPRTLSSQEVEHLFQQSLSTAVAEITSNKNYFLQTELTRRTLEVSQEYGIPAETVEQGVTGSLSSDSQFVSLGSRNGLTLWTTREILALENDFRQNVDKLRLRPFCQISDQTLDAALSSPRSHDGQQYFLTPEQKEAVRYLTQGQGAVKCISGYPGSGKTEMLAVTKEVLEKEGYYVIGAALAGVAARNLQEQAGIESDTLRMREIQLSHDAGQILKHHAKQLWRAACGKETFALPQLAIDRRTVLIIDEAGMVGVRDFAFLAKKVVEQGGTLIAVGDERQLSAIERPGAFEYLVNELDGLSLTEIRRQDDPADREALKHIVQGSPELALQHYAEKGQFCVARNQPEAEAELVSDWRKNGGAKNPIEHRLFASTHAEVDRLNKLCQWERVQTGYVDAQDRVAHHGQLFMAGDRVRFDKSARQHGIKKGETGTVLATKDGLTGKYVSIAIDQEEANLRERFVEATKFHARQVLNQALGRRIEQPLRRDNLVVLPLETLNPLAKSYGGLRLDYAVTAHLAQGQTVKNSYVLLSDSLQSKELAYVQASRHKNCLWLYASEEQAGNSLTELARSKRPLEQANEVQPPEVLNYSLLIDQLKRSESQELASVTHRNSIHSLHNENPHVH